MSVEHKFKVGDRVRFNSKLLEQDPMYDKCMDIIGVIEEISLTSVRVKKGPRTDGVLSVKEGGVGCRWSMGFFKLADPDEDEYGEVCP